MATRNSTLNKDYIKKKLIAAGVPNSEEKIKELNKIVAKYIRNPFLYVSNQIHQYILVFRKEK